MKITVEEMKPCVRFASVVARNADYEKYYYSYDYRLFYVVSGTMTFYFTEKVIQLFSGDLLIFPPSTPYKIKYNNQGGGKYIVLNFDFDFSASSQKAKSPDTEENFCREKIFSSSYVDPFDSIYHKKSAFFIEEQLSDICSEAEKNDIYSLEYSSALLKKTILDILRFSRQNLSSAPQHLCDEVKNYIRTNFSNNITNISVAENFGYHPYYLNSIFVKCCGMTMHNYLMQVRLSKSKNLLLCTNLSISQIAEQCGFQNQSYFSECFKEAFSKRPTEYRNQGI